MKNSSSICQNWFQIVRALAPFFSDETNERSYTSLHYTSTNCCISKKLHQKPMKWALKIKVIGEENWTSFLGFFFCKDKGVYMGTKWGLEFLLFIYRLQRYSNAIQYSTQHKNHTIQLSCGHKMEFHCKILMFTIAENITCRKTNEKTL